MGMKFIIQNESEWIPVTQDLKSFLNFVEYLIVNIIIPPLIQKRDLL